MENMQLNGVKMKIGRVAKLSLAVLGLNLMVLGPTFAAPKASVVKKELVAKPIMQQYMEAQLAAVAAATCAGTYVPEGKAIEFDYIKQFGFKVTPYAEKVDGINVNFVVATNPLPYQGRRLTVLAFRGSQDKGDWDINFKTKQVPFAPQVYPHNTKDVPRVHDGFNAYAKAAMKIPVDIDGDGRVDNIPEKLAAEPDLMLLLTGHSLGGAVATLVDEYLVADGAKKEQVPAITFGAPAIGNKYYAEKYGPRIDLTRYVTSYDPVPGSLQSFFGGFKQFGKLEKYKLSGNYSDFQHPISFYCDLAIKNYYDVVDIATLAGVLPPMPDEQLKGTEPIVALALTALDKGVDERYAPNIRRFALEEYLSILPRYAVIASNVDLNHPKLNFRDLLDKADEKGAKYLIVLDVDRHNVGQTNNWYIGVNQGIFTVPEGNLVGIESGSSRVNFNKGVVQATISLLEQCKEDVKTHLPFVRQVVEPTWRTNF